MTLRKHTMFDFCAIYDCSIHYSSDNSNRDSVYTFAFKDLYTYRYTVKNIDLYEVDHRTLECKMLDTVARAYKNRNYTPRTFKRYGYTVKNIDLYEKEENNHG